jgi:hypothetical protein
MKKLLSSLVLVLGMIGGCASSQPEDGPVVGPEPSATGMYGGNLDDLIAQQPGVLVEGRGPQARIRVSGADYRNSPLFVLDGVGIGFSFGSIWSLVSASDVESIRVIRANDTAAAAWGSRGGNGVIEIRTKRGV